MAPSYFIGLMSGTSADGVDAALVSIQEQQIELISFLETPLPSDLKNTLMELNRSQTIHLEKLCLLEKEIAELFVAATKTLLEANNLAAEQITAIGSHGQTIYHAPQIPMTLQIGHPAFIAKQSEITTVADFRVDDMALGGQGAPFAPAFHQQIFATEQACFVTNIGGIANISYVPENGSERAILGWDTGPGNALMDDLCQHAFDMPFDRDGDLASQGQVNPILLDKLIQHPYFSMPPAKSTGRETFKFDWVQEIVGNAQIEINELDLLATLAELTAVTIARQIKSIAQQNEPVWIVGGGAFNPYLISRIQTHLSGHKVCSALDKQINPNAVEAMMCAWLAQQRIAEVPVKLSAVTGASRDAVLGGIWHP